MVQKTVPEKHHLWATTGGHPKAGENNLNGFVTEIKEELGLLANPSELKLFKTIKIEDDFVDLYYLKHDFNIEEITIQKEEVEAVKWVSIEELELLIKDGFFYHLILNFIDIV